MPFVTSWWVAGIALTVWGVFYMLVVINSVTYRQQVTPEHLLGRVNTAGRMLAWGMGWTGGAFLAGVLVGWLGLVPTLVVLSSTGVLATAVAWTSPCARSSLARGTGLLVGAIRQRALPLARAEVAPRHLARERERVVEGRCPTGRPDRRTTPA